MAKQTTRIPHGDLLNFFRYRTSLGPLTISCNGSGITALCFGGRTLPGEYRPSELTDCAARQLKEYFSRRRRGFDVPLAPEGTVFQKSVWDALRAIPYGETRSYQQIAEVIGNPLSCRAVGMANNKNPIPILIPCHRVVGSNGSLVGYAGGLKIKQFLLTLEQDTPC